MPASLVDGFSGHSNSHGFVDSEHLLCWTRAELQVPLVYLSVTRDAMRSVPPGMLSGMDGDPLFKKAVMGDCSALQHSDNDALKIHCDIFAVCVMLCVPSRQT